MTVSGEFFSSIFPTHPIPAAVLEGARPGEPGALEAMFEGSVSISTAEKNLRGVPLGMRWVLFKDGSEPQLLDIAPPHQDHLLGLDEA